jgi:hypothetical protein
VTLLGLVPVVLARSSGGTLSWVGGVLEVSGGWPARVLRLGFPFSGPVAAMTLGHIVLGVSADALNATREHERVHVRQFERWGLLLLLLYPLAGLHVWLKGGNPYLDNPFERQARVHEKKHPC